ncbi:hypothetical protein MJO29_005567, partial [Puccinia striiformis f. sp. tritici]
MKKRYDIMHKSYGIVDSINDRFIAAKKSFKGNEIVEQLMKSDYTRLFNPFLRLNGFDGCLDTPVEILHVILLGVVKYMVRDFLNKLKEKGGDE